MQWRVSLIVPLVIFMSYADTIVCYVLDHKAMYNAGILHRDVSAGNILICPKKGDKMENTHGRLIDLDHAGQTSEFIEPKIVDGDTVQSSYTWLKHNKIFVDIDVIRIALEHQKDPMLSIKYITTSVQALSHKFTKERPCTLADLGWRGVVRLYN